MFARLACLVLGHQWDPVRVSYWYQGRVRCRCWRCDVYGYVVRTRLGFDAWG